MAAVSLENREKIRKWTEAHREEYVSELIRLVNIPSVSEEGAEGYPFGPGPARALDHTLKLAEGFGLETENDDYYCGSAILPGKAAEHEIAYVCHLDVVPEGEGWSYPPFDASVVEGQVVGRGASDNKGSALATLYALRCLKELGIPLRSNARVLWGCNEEAGMKDTPHFLEKHKEKLPDLFLVCDCQFPFHHGEKGILMAELTKEIEDEHLAELTGGVTTNSVPERAGAVLKNIAFADACAHITGEQIRVEQEGESVRVTAFGKAGHAAFPERGTENAIGKLAKALGESGLLSEKETEAMQFLAAAVSGYDGVFLGVAGSDEISGNTTAVGGMIRLQGKKLIQTVDIRYAIQTDREKLVTGLQQAARNHGFQVEHLNDRPPMYLPLDAMNGLPGKLVKLSEELLGRENLEPIILAGATHARTLPNAIGYGPSVPGADPPRIGYAHGANEAVHIEIMMRAIQIYAASLIAIDEMLTE